MATPDPLAVGKYFSLVMPENWTKSMPHSLATSVKRNGLDSVCFVRTIEGATTVMRSPAMFETILAWDLLPEDSPGAGDFPGAPVLAVALADVRPGRPARADGLGAVTARDHHAIATTPSVPGPL